MDDPQGFRSLLFKDAQLPGIEEDSDFGRTAAGPLLLAGSVE